jgi:hypothetical protein
LFKLLDSSFSKSFGMKETDSIVLIASLLSAVLFFNRFMAVECDNTSITNVAHINLVYGGKSYLVTL